MLHVTEIAFFRIPQNGGHSSGASFENRIKRFFGSDSQMVGPVSHVSLFLNLTYVQRFSKFSLENRSKESRKFWLEFRIFNYQIM